jgi:hypothetical protein
MVELGNVDNTSDADKPVSSATQTALDMKAPLASPTLTGIPLAPTAEASVNSTQIATTAFVQTAVNNLVGGAPTLLNTLNELALAINSDASFATHVTTLIGTKAPIDSPTFTGTVSGISKSMVELGDVDNTSDANKPISNATQTALNLKAPLANPTFTGTVTTSGLTVSSGQVTLPSASISDSALSGNVVTTTGSQTLTNKTITTSGTLTANAGLVVAGSDASLNNNLVVGGNTTMNGALIFGSLPVTKYYMWSGTPSETTITSPMVKLTFGNASFYAKIHCFLTDGANANNLSSQILEVQGGNTNGTTPSFNILSISRTTTANSYYWKNPTFDTNSVYLGSESLAGVAGHYTNRVELIQTNGNMATPPTLQTITMTTNNSGGTAITTYNY